MNACFWPKTLFTNNVTFKKLFLPKIANDHNEACFRRKSPYFKSYRMDAPANSIVSITLKKSLKIFSFPNRQRFLLVFSATE